MIYNVKYSSSGDRSEVLDYITNNKLKAIDVGGATSFANGHLEAVMDFLEPATESKVKFLGNINMPYVWNEALEYVKKNGKFDFAICTHTIEDICNPQMVCEMLPKIAKEGFIATPSKYMEMSRIGEAYRGFIHHLNILDVIQGMLVSFPKINYIESSVFDSLGNQHHNIDKTEISFWWKDDLPFTVINGGYLGATVDDVKDMYNILLD
jgi:hypothetical protein